jgi:outer membrane protein OmpA-like peptidoglycan-associated protein
VDDTLNEVPQHIDFDVRKIELGHSYTLRDILFETDSYDLTRVSKRVIEDFADFLKQNPGVNVAIYGHTDNQGDAAMNLRLSGQRAHAVYDYLISLGIGAARLSYKGFGQTKPVAGNETPEGRAKNRRTEFFIIHK